MLSSAPNLTAGPDAILEHNLESTFHRQKAKFEKANPIKNQKPHNCICSLYRIVCWTIAMVEHDGFNEEDV